LRFQSLRRSRCALIAGEGARAPSIFKIKSIFLDKPARLEFRLQAALFLPFCRLKAEL